MKSIPHNSNQPSRRGITLLEVAVSSLLIGLLTVASMKTTGGVLRTWNGVQNQYDESGLAEQLLAEVLQASYEDPDGSPVFGIEGGETSSPTNRSEFDDTDDYDDWTETPPKQKDGTTLSGFTGWTRLINVQKLNKNNPTQARNDNSADKGLRRVTVTVTDPQGNQTSVNGWRSNAGSPDQPQGKDGTFVVWMGCKLKIGSSGESISSGTDILNHATVQ